MRFMSTETQFTVFTWFLKGAKIQYHKGRPGNSDGISIFILSGFHCEFSYISTYLRLLLENTTNDVPVAVKIKIKFGKMNYLLRYML